MTKRFWSCALVTLLSTGVSAGFSLAGLLGPGSDDSFARYAASRSVALLLVRARVLAIFILVYQGSFALGSATWGAIAQRCRFPFLS